MIMMSVYFKKIDELIYVSDSATRFLERPEDKVFVTGSHGGVYPGYLAASLKVRGAVFNDAGVGRENSGIAGLGYLDKLGIAALTVSNNSARIGDGADIYKRGIVSFVNLCAGRLGCRVGMHCRDAAELLKKGSQSSSPVPSYQEARRILVDSLPRIVCIDSASLVLPEDEESVVVTGSHGGLLNGQKAAALKYDAVAAFYNDAGIGIDNAGITRLPALDERNIIAGTVSAQSARIGDALSTYNDGILSVLNEKALSCGGKIGMSLKEFIGMIRHSYVKR